MAKDYGNNPLKVGSKRLEKWEEADTIWNAIEEFWNEFAFFIDVFGGRGKTPKRKLELYKDLEKDEKKRAIRLICKVKGVKFEEEKEIQDFEVTVDDIDLVLERAKRLRPKLYMEMTGE